jgi:flagellar basal body P-ring protein FlgI
LAEIIAKLRQQEPGKYRPVGEISQVKTYRVETLHGFGLVVDLTELARNVGASGRLSQPGITSLGSVLKPGTGATSAEPFRKGELVSAADLKAALALLDRTADDELLQAIPETLWERRAVTLVTVTVNIPPEGAHQGDRLDCHIRSFEPKSLSGGFLLPTKLYPPGPRDKAPVGIAAGPVVSESTLRAAGDRVVGGCLVQQDIQEEFVRDGKIRLLLKPEHASFLVAQDIADRINVEVGLFAGKPIARALSSSVIEVEVPPGFEDNPVGFVTQVLRLPSSVPVEQSATVPLRSTIPEGRR